MSLMTPSSSLDFSSCSIRSSATSLRGVTNLATLWGRICLLPAERIFFHSVPPLNKHTNSLLGIGKNCLSMHSYYICISIGMTAQTNLVYTWTSILTELWISCGLILSPTPSFSMSMMHVQPIESLGIGLKAFRGLPTRLMHWTDAILTTIQEIRRLIIILMHTMYT